MVAYVFAEDFSAFFIHISRLGKHTTDMENDARVSLLIPETDDSRPDPQTLAQVSIRCIAKLPLIDPGYSRAESLYLAHFPKAKQLFSRGDLISGR